MGIDFDESGKNEEYEADASESTGEAGDVGKPRHPAAPITIAPTAVHGNVNDLVASIMGTSQPQQAPQTAEEALDSTQSEYMDQVEERLDVAAHYRILLSHPMFDNNTKAANIVSFEVQGFLRQRLGELLGIGGPAKKETFTPAQVESLRLLGDLPAGHVTALRLVASRLTGEAPPPREAPTTRPAPAPSAPATRPAPAPAGPRRTAPAKAPAGPVAAQPARAPDIAPPRGPGRPPGAKNRPKAGEAPMVQAIRKHPDGTEEPLFDKDGNPRMVRLARVQRPSGAMPFPNEAQMSGVTEAQAAGRAHQLEQNPNVRAALTGLQNPV